MKSRPYQFPIQVGSLTTNILEQSNMLMRSDKAVRGKTHLAVDSKRCVHRGYREQIKEELTLGWLRPQGKDIGCRTTNHESIVKVNQIKSQMSGDRKGRANFRLAKPEISGGENGKAPRDLLGVKVDGMCSKDNFKATGETLINPHTNYLVEVKEEIRWHTH